MVVGVIAANAAGNRFSDAACKVSISIECPKTSGFNDVILKNAVFSISSTIIVGVSRRFHLTWDCWLLSKFLSYLELILPFLTNFDNVTGKFMTDNDWMVFTSFGTRLCFSPCLTVFHVDMQMESDTTLTRISSSLISEVQIRQGGYHPHHINVLLLFSYFYLFFFSCSGYSV